MTTFGHSLIQGQIWLRKLKKAKLLRSKLELNFGWFTSMKVAKGKPRFAFLYFWRAQMYVIA
jgi:hypothetical protein